MDLHAMGYQAYKDGMQELQIKSHPPLFRAGWRAAEADFNNKSDQAPVRTHKVAKHEKVPYVLKWKDINCALQYNYWKVLHEREELEVLVVAMRRVIWARRDSITSYTQVVKMVRTMWEGMLQLGYDENILTVYD